MSGVDDLNRSPRGWLRLSAGALGLIVLLGPSLPRADEPASPDPGTRAGTGRLEGSVTVGPKLSARRMRFSLYPDPHQAPPPAPDSSGAGELKNVVVYLEGDSPGLGTAPLRPGAQVMAQQGTSFVPHVLAVVKGSTVDFPNADPIFHNVFSLSKAASFDLGRYPSGSTKSVRFDTPGVVKVFCHIHSDMSAVVLVLENPFFAAPDSRGHVEIGGIPPGEYRVVAWHERARLVSKKVKIEAGKSSLVNFIIPLTEAESGG